MSRALNYSDYYVSHGGMIPVKWTAPEVFIPMCHWQNSYTETFAGHSLQEVHNSQRCVEFWVCNVWDMECWAQAIWRFHQCWGYVIITRYLYLISINCNAGNGDGDKGLPTSTASWLSSTHLFNDDKLLVIVENSCLLLHSDLSVAVNLSMELSN